MTATKTRPRAESEAGARRDRRRREDALVEKVRDRYGRIAESGRQGCCGSGPSPCETSDAASRLGYDPQEIGSLPTGANLGLGCGAPIQFLELRPGEVVLDLGSGAGLDAFLAARRVGPEGRVIGVDMTPEMVRRARRNAAEAGLEQVEFRSGRLEALPLEDASVDAVTSNCVINLVPDKASVFAEIARVLKPGGRLVISDILLESRLPEAVESDLLAYVGCVAGAMERGPYFELVEAAGLSEIEVLSDVDALAAFADSFPEEAAGYLERTGVRREELEGKVRSVTFRARSTPQAEARLQNLLPIAVVIAGGCEPCARRMVARALDQGSSEREIRKTLAIVDHFRRQECFAESVGPEVVARMERPLEAARQTLSGRSD